jgi:small-conductance mechanosensitive channel
MNQYIELMLQNEVFQDRYVIFVILLILIYLSSRLMVFLSTQVFLKIAKRTKTIVDDLIVERTKKPMVKLFVSFGLRFSINVLNLPPLIDRISNHIFDSLMIIFSLIIISRVLSVIIQEWGHNFANETDTHVDEEILPLFIKTSEIMIVIMCIIFILQRWNVDVTGLLAGVGIAGIAIGLAVKDSLSNIFGGVSLILDKTFRKGDVIKLDTGETGKIFSVGLRSTKVMNFDGEMIIVPNSIMANTKIRNNMQPDLSVRVTIEFGTSYSSDPEKVKVLVTDILNKTPGVFITSDKPIKVWFIEMGDFALKFKAMFWVLDINVKYDVHQQAINNLFKGLNKAKINIPFPTQTLFIKK